LEGLAVLRHPLEAVHRCFAMGCTQGCTNVPKSGGDLIIAKESRVDPKTIPLVTEPRGQIGIVSEMKGCQCSFGRYVVIRETIGGKSRKMMWKGPDAHAETLGADLRKVANTEKARQKKAYHDLLKQQIEFGAVSACIPEAHSGVIVRIDIPEAATESLKALQQGVHNAYQEGCGEYNIDEYSVLFDELPVKYSTKEEFLNGFLRSPNAMANDQTASWRNPLGVLHDFDTFNRFELRKAGTKDKLTDADPQIGDWYHIRIPGNNGDVMLLDYEVGDLRCSATVGTMTDHEYIFNDDHPVSGRRQYGVEVLPDGRHRFYTRGFDRQTSILMDLQISNMAQHQSWTCLMRAMAKEHGGCAEKADEPDVWGWCRQLPAEVLLSCVRDAKIVDPEADAAQAAQA